jgi:hypothetical protein
MVSGLQKAGIKSMGVALLSELPLQMQFINC